MTDADMVLWREGKATKLAEKLATDLASIKPLLVIIDSAVFAFDDDEIKRRTVAGFLVHLNRLARTLEASVGLVTHTSKAGSPSGSTAWQNQARAGLLLEKTDDGPILKTLKSNYGKDQQPIQLRSTEDGVLVSGINSSSAPTVTPSSKSWTAGWRRYDTGDNDDMIGKEGICAPIFRGCLRAQEKARQERAVNRASF